MQKLCPCGSPQTYSKCCAPLHRHTEAPLTAEALMRSRYSAFAEGNVSYLRYSWHPSHRPDDLDLEKGLRWSGLRIVATSGGASTDAVGSVEFVATFEVDGRAGEVHEVSNFERIDGRWIYTCDDARPAMTAAE